MVTTIGIGALILAAVIGTALLWWINEPAVNRGVSFVERVRWSVGIVFLILLSYHLLRSGNLLYIMGAVLGFGFLTAYALVEKPWREVI